MTVIITSKTPELQAEMNEKYLKHLDANCARMEYTYRMFAAGRDTQTVLQGLINMHRPASYWEEKQKIA